MIPKNGCILVTVLALSCITAPVVAQAPPPSFEDPGIRNIIGQVSADRIERDIRKLVSFGTRHTASDTLSSTRGIGAARRWIKAQFDSIAVACGGCLEVSYVAEVFELREGLRINVVNVVAVQRGRTDPDRIVLMSGDIDSRISDRWNAIDSSPGANDNASGMAGTLEAARVLSQRTFDGTIVYTGLSGEEQGLYGGGTVARWMAEMGWRLEAVLNNDMIGNIQGVNGIVENNTARVFSDAVPPTETDRERAARRRTGGEVDGISRQLARYVDRIADVYLPSLDVWMIYRLDRFGRGGHHTPFANLGFPAVRIMETNENYTRQHQDIRTENGIDYGDVLAGVDFEYAATLTRLNVAVLASLASSPGAPTSVYICGAVEPWARLTWEPPVGSSSAAGYRVYWRRTDAPQWTNSQWVGSELRHEFTNLSIDNYYFGVASVSSRGTESAVVFPQRGGRQACDWSG